MLHSKLFSYSLALCGIPFIFPEIARAQYYVPLVPVGVDGGVCGLGHCRYGENGTLIDKRTGDVYDRRGNLIRRSNNSSQPSSTNSYSASDSSVDAYTTKCRKALAKWKARRDQYGSGTPEYQMSDAMLQTMSSVCRENGADTGSTPNRD
jgi:hypothetical protein